MGCIVGVSACIRWCCGRGDFLVLFVTGLSLGFPVGFRSFSRRNIVSGCLSLRRFAVGWAWALSFVDVFFLTFHIRVGMLGVLWLLDCLGNGGGELH